MVRSSSASADPFLAVAIPCVLALACFTVVDTIRRAMGKDGTDGVCRKARIR
jgi:hypothetical protein